MGMRKDRYENYDRQTHVTHMLSIFIAEIPKGDGFGDEARQACLEFNEHLEAHIKIYEQSRQNHAPGASAASSQRTLS
jgi:hypothetical protein